MSFCPIGLFAHLEANIIFLLFENPFKKRIEGVVLSIKRPWKKG